MILLIRIILISLIIYLLIRSFARFGQEADEEAQHNSTHEQRKVKERKISSETGEYIDFEEVEKKR